MNQLKIAGTAAGALLIYALGTFAVAGAESTIVYDNSQNYLEKYASVDSEYGDQINLAGDARTVTDFAFEYFGDFLASGKENARIRFYANDGPAYGAFYTKPGTLLYDSGVFSINTGQRTKILNGLNVPVPDTFTWTVQFGGVTYTTGSDAGLLYANPVTVGSSFRSYYWQKDPDTGNPDTGGWLPHANNAGIPNNFLAQVKAVPEPSTVQCFFASLIGLGGYAALRRRDSR